MRRRIAFVPWLIAAIALAAIARWPSYVGRRADVARAATLPTPAPVAADYVRRDAIIAFWERAQAKNLRGDMLSPGMLSAQYLQRYRERGDAGDALRALAEARRSLRAQPRGNLAGETDLGAALLTLHRFKEALRVTRDAERDAPGDPGTLIREASLDLELGRYEAAGAILTALRRDAKAFGTGAGSIPLDTLRTRYDELTGHLARARERFARVTAYANAQLDEPAQSRAWFSVRSGELAFEAGAVDEATADERVALAVFPNDADANRLLARFSCALHDWRTCLGAASAAAAIVPYPETLGYEVDAQRALGDGAAAARTDDLIRTIERIGNAQHISDRLLAIYYDEHRERVDDAYAIAKRELAVRDDVFTEDTLAWAAAMSGRWEEARVRSRRALRYGTENALLLYHAGVIAQRSGANREARRRFTAALQLNPAFHPSYADDARARLRALAAESA